MTGLEMAQALIPERLWGWAEEVRGGRPSTLQQQLTMGDRRRNIQPLLTTTAAQNS